MACCYARVPCTAQMNCTVDFSKGMGSGVAEAIGGWGFSNNKVSNPGYELSRLKCLFTKMDCLRSTNPMLCVRYDRKNDPEAWTVAPSLHECKPVWTFPMKRPLITYSSTLTTRPVSNLLEVSTDLTFYIPEKNYALQGTEKWYRRGPDCCPQPSCLAPNCPVPCTPCCP